MTDTAIFLFCAVVVHPAPPRLREDEKVLAETAETAEEIINLLNQINLSETTGQSQPWMGDWLTQINWIIKIFCAICERIGGFSQKSQMIIIKSA